MPVYSHRSDQEFVSDSLFDDSDDSSISQNTIPSIRTLMFISCTSRIAKAVPLHATKALGGRGGVAPTHYLPLH
jgi:hypothetical protein